MKDISPLGLLRAAAPSALLLLVQPKPMENILQDECH